MVTYLITGGAGFIGSNFIQYMFNKYDNDIFIINADLLTYAGNLENLRGIAERGNYIFRNIDICQKEEVEKIFLQYDIDYIVNFAAESHVDRSIINPEVFVRTNILGTQVLLNTAKSYWETENGFPDNKRYIQISTDEVYGSLGDTGSFHESSLIDPHSPYAASKACADLLVKAFYDTYGMPVNITRCSNNYGPWQFPEKLIPLIIGNALEGKKLPVYGDGKNVRDWIYVKDHCRAVDMVIQKGIPGHIYNIGGHCEKENIELVKTILRILKSLMKRNDPRRSNICESLITYVPDRKGHDRRYAMNTDKIHQDLGWLPQTSFDNGIRQTILWYLKHQDWLSRVRSGAYLEYYRKMYA